MQHSKISRVKLSGKAKAKASDLSMQKTQLSEENTESKDDHDNIEAVYIGNKSISEQAIGISDGKHGKESIETSGEVSKCDGNDEDGLTIKDITFRNEKEDHHESDEKKGKAEIEEKNGHSKGNEGSELAPESIARLPDELVEMIMSRLWFDNLVNFGCTCKSFYKMSLKPEYWHKLSMARWARRDTPLWLKMAPEEKWRELYVEKHKVGRHELCHIIYQTLWLVCLL